jgi:3-oxoadipate enol-lactonase
MATLFHRSEGAGPPLVLVHGVGGDSTSWDGVAPLLSDRFRVIRPDLSGHGRSGLLREPVTIERFARDVTSVMDSLGVEDAFMAGTSLGGTILQAIALGSPKRVRKMALLSTACGRSEEERAKAVARIDVIRKEGLAPIAAANRDRWFTEEFQRRNPELVEARARVLMASDVESYLHAYTVFATADLSEELPKIRTPTMIVTGEHDIAATPRMARLMHERIAGSRLEILPGLRHSLLIEAAPKISALLGEFFQ